MSASKANKWGQVLGIPVLDWQPCLRPSTVILEGQYCRLERLNPVKHIADLWAAQQTATDGHDWTYLPYGPFTHLEDYSNWVKHMSTLEDPYFFAIINAHTQQAVGVASLMRIDAANGVIEVGHIYYSPLLQRTRAATEAMYLLMKYCFELGYRRYEWKCNALNEPSRQAAVRLGFSFEGIFRQAAIVKGYNRDTAWYSLLDSEWTINKQAFEAWLNPNNFNDQGQQLQSLMALRNNLLMTA
jgi:RimJ/RimL family protein N-acetyltransferase